MTRPRTASARSAPRVAPAALLVVVLVAVLAGCGSGGGGSDAGDERSGRATTTVGGPCADLEPFGDFGEVLVDIGGTERCLLLAEDPDQRARGLMDVTDLEGYPGMLFAFPSDTEGGFWMRNTPTPLSIAHLDASGTVVATLDMDPCEDRPDCPVYEPGVTYRTAVEVPQGDLEAVGLTDGATLEFQSAVDPS
ncbi:MAG TPA: DUF192 domain-containing protein [Acidimicrobiales bacterium]|nr:DUF192 domain-containing protein [Acidimicrobiales bacterium]